MVKLTKLDKTVLVILVVIQIFVGSLGRAVEVKMASSISLLILSGIFIMYILVQRSKTKHVEAKNIGVKETLPLKPTNNFIAGLVITIFVALGFYWFEIRPSNIRKECSFVVVHIDAKPPFLGKTEAELLDEGSLMDCTNTSGTYRQYCEDKNMVTIKNWKSRPVEEPRDVIQQVTQAKYNLCIQSKGLIR